MAIREQCHDQLPIPNGWFAVDFSHELREGDVVDGLVVRRIEPSAVAFEHEGSELLRRVGLDSD